jgi:outer membrane receptor protein involved in Fe transport
MGQYAVKVSCSIVYLSILLGALSFSLLARAQVNDQQLVSFAIHVQPADQAIKALARQAKASVIFPSSLIKDVLTNSVQGQMTLPEALERLLAGTSLDGHVSAHGIITIKPKSTPMQGSSKRPNMISMESKPRRESDDHPPKLETLVVTGSNIRGKSLVGGNVLSIDAEELRQSNVLTVADYLRRLPLNLAAGVGMEEATLSSQDYGPDQANLSAGQGVNLRGLGALSTLVLVNGRRMANSGQYGDYVDISHIPLVAVARLEILLDGASAIYGSDAVAGVVNIVTQKSIEDPQTNISIGRATGGGGVEKRFSHAFSYHWQDGSLTLGAEAYGRTSIAMTSRQYYRNGSDFSQFGGVNWQSAALNFNLVPTLFNDGVSGANAEVGAVVPIGSNNALSNADLTLSNGNYSSDYNVYTGRDLLPDSERFGAFFSVEHDLTSRVMLRVQGMSNYRKSVYQLGYPIINTAVVMPDSPYYISDISEALSRSDGAIAFGKVETAQTETSTSSVHHYSGSAAAYVDFADNWQVEGVLSYAKDNQRRLKYALRDGNGSGILACSLGDYSVTDCDDSILAYNPFSTLPMSKSLQAQLYGYEDLRFNSQVMQGAVKLDGTLLTHRTGEVKMAMGIDYRQEKIDGELSTQMLSIATLDDSFNQTKRNTLSLFGEWLIPLSRSIDIQLAGRYEDFSGTGNYNTFDPKLGFDWRLSENWTLQGALGTSFHAPAMRYEDDSPQLTPGGNAAYTLNIGRFGPCTSEQVTFNGIIGTPGNEGEQCSMTVLVISGGAGPNKLKPEESQSWSLGLSYTPTSMPGMTARLRYFNINVDHRIQRIQSGTFNQILEDFFATGDTYDSALTINPSTSEVQEIMDSDKYLGTYGQSGIADSAEDVTMIVDATQRNIGALREQGIDINLEYHQQLNGIALTGFLSGTYVFEYALQAAEGKPFINYRNRYLSTGAPTAFRSKQGMSALWDNWQLRINSQFVSAYKCFVCYSTAANGEVVNASNGIKINSWLTWDLGIDWQTQVHEQDVKFSFNVKNLFATEAPFVDAGTGIDDAVPEAYDFANHSGTGRTISLNARIVW